MNKSKKRARRRRRRKDPAPYLVGAGLVLVVLLGCLPLLSGAGETEPDGAEEPVSQESQGPVEAQETEESAPVEKTEPGADCPALLRELLERNPETYDFVAGYPGTYDLDADLEEDYTPGEIPHLFQWDTRWGYYPYGGNRVQDLLGLSGCGPTALSMVVVGMTGDTAWNPAKVAQYAAEAGYVTREAGTAWALMSEGCSRFGLTAQDVPLWEDTMVQALDSSPLICALGPGDFTEVGHFIVIAGYEEGAFRVLGPNSQANSEKAWSYDTLEPQIKAIWSFSLED